MFTYIKYNVPNTYVVLEESLNPEEYDNLGSTWQDYLNNKWVLLSEEQVKFHEDNPTASVKEVWDMEVFVYERTLADAKREKIQEIDSYDTSENVNGFTINHMITTWFTVQERLNYKQSVEAAKLLGVETLQFYVDDNMLNVSPTNAEMMLAALQLYADQCFIVTKQHKIAVEKLETIDEVDNYDYKTGYPEKLNFDLI